MTQLKSVEARKCAPVLVTGAARGLGAAVAQALAEEGVEPLLLGRTLASLEGTRASIEGILGRPVRCAVADIADWNAVKRSVDSVLTPAERLGGVVNNAGVIEPIDRVDDTDPARWAECIQVNLVGAYNVLRACLPRLAPGGVIANISSGAATAEHAGWSAYAASKAGLERLSATLAAERPDLVVLAVRPGVTATDMQVAIKASRVDNAIRQLPREALQSPEVPARAITALFVQKLRAIPERVVEARGIRELLADARGRD